MDVEAEEEVSGQEQAERALLAGFSRITTRDREEVVHQLCQLLGERCSPETAAFFLDMNDWNLQEAACCYLELFNDSDSNQQNNRENEPPSSNNELSSANSVVSLPRYSMLFLSKEYDFKTYPPGAEFLLSFTVKNNGLSPWPDGCVIRTSKEYAELPVKVEPLSPGATALLECNFTAPTGTGLHTLFFGLYLPTGMHFGDMLFANIEVKDYAEEQVMEE